MKAKVRLNNYKFNTINISGSKNSSLPIIAASILCDEDVIITNIPDISDVRLLINILKKINYNIDYNNNTLIVKPSNIDYKKYTFSEIKKLRGSYYLLGALIGKTNNIDITFLFPGGCKLGKRPIDYHIHAFTNMGLNIKIKKNKIHIKGNKYNICHRLKFPSVGATINILLASSKIEKETIIYNASIEPEVIDLCNFLKSMGATININNRTITIIGCKYFHSSKYKVMEDRIEAGTFLILGAVHQGIKVNNINPNNVSPLTNLLINCGYLVKIDNNSITVIPQKNIIPFTTVIEPHPGFPTDLGPLLCVLASQINGKSSITDMVFNNRISHIKQLRKMNINISNNQNTITIIGKNNINNKSVKAMDLRCAAALLIAATLNTSFSTIKNIDKLFRGYENIQNKLNDLGIDFIVK